MCVIGAAAYHRDGGEHESEAAAADLRNGDTSLHGHTFVHVRAQLERLQDKFTS